MRLRQEPVERQLNLPLLNPLDYGINYVRPRTAAASDCPTSPSTACRASATPSRDPRSQTRQRVAVLGCCSARRWGATTCSCGGEFRRGVEDFDIGFFSVGRFVFNGVYTGDSFADFLLGRASSSTTRTGRTKLEMRNQNLGAFFQDDFQVARSADVEPRRPLRLLQPDHRRARPDLDIRRSQRPDRRAAERRRRRHHRRHRTACRRIRPTSRDKNNLQPRVGFAWDVFGNGRSALRGGARHLPQPAAQQPRAAALLSYPFQEQPVSATRRSKTPSGRVGPPVIGQLYSTDPDIVMPYTVVYSVGVAVRSSCRQHGAGVAYVQNDGKDLLQFQEMNQPIYVAGADQQPPTRICSGRTRAIQSVLRSTNWGHSDYKGSKRACSAGSRRGSASASPTRSRPRTTSRPDSTPARPAPPTCSNRRTRQPRGRVCGVRLRRAGTASRPRRSGNCPSAPDGSGSRAARWRRCLAAGRSRASGRSRAGSPTTSSTASDPCLRAGGYTPSCRPEPGGRSGRRPEDRPRVVQHGGLPAHRAGQFGTAPRNSFRGPGLVNTDFAFIKRVYSRLARAWTSNSASRRSTRSTTSTSACRT